MLCLHWIRRIYGKQSSSNDNKQQCDIDILMLCIEFEKFHSFRVCGVKVRHPTLLVQIATWYSCDNMFICTYNRQRMLETKKNSDTTTWNSQCRLIFFRFLGKLCLWLQNLQKCHFWHAHVLRPPSFQRNMTCLCQYEVNATSYFIEISIVRTIVWPIA